MAGAYCFIGHELSCSSFSDVLELENIFLVSSLEFSKKNVIPASFSLAENLLDPLQKCTHCTVFQDSLLCRISVRDSQISRLQI